MRSRHNAPTRVPAANHGLTPGTITDRILHALPAGELARILPRLEGVELAARTLLMVPDRIVESVYFVEAGAFPLVSTLEDGTRIEVGVEENARAHQILRSAVDYAIITLDSQGCITGWSQGAQHVLGCAEAEVLGRSGDMVFTAEDRGQGRFLLELCRALEEGRAANERWHVRRDGTRFWASGLMMPLLLTATANRTGS